MRHSVHSSVWLAAMFLAAFLWGRPGVAHAAPTRDAGCRAGYVWRRATPADHVCVEPWARDRVAGENAEGPSHTEHSPLGARPQCQAGYVLRLALPHDQVCVTVAAHAQAQDENVLAGSRQAR